MPRGRFLAKKVTLTPFRLKRTGLQITLFDVTLNLPLENLQSKNFLHNGMRFLLKLQVIFEK